jgi:MoxR-like ATPase
MSTLFKSDTEGLQSFVTKYSALESEIGKIIVGQQDTIRDVLISVFSRGHCLLVGVPGLAKTLLVNTIADALGLSFNRIQFTPDLMPGDIIGSEVLNEQRHFQFIKGPLFSNIILADEINRTPPKTQAALLEAMQERQVTAAGKKYLLDDPFFVLATQNPIEQEGTYPLPEAQLDRFMFNVWLDYPAYEEELQVVKRTTSDQKVKLNKILSAEEITAYQELIRKMPVADNVVEYAVKLVHKTRLSGEFSSETARKYLQWGAGPRASQFLIIGAKCHAAIRGKFSPDIEDVKAIAIPILRHRLVLNYKAEAEGIQVQDLIKQIM